MVRVFALLIALAPLTSCVVISNKHYLQENAGKEGWTVTESGLQYKMKRTTAKRIPHPTASTPVLVTIKGSMPHNNVGLTDGTPLHKKERYSTPRYETGGHKVILVPGRVMKGLAEALYLMKEGDIMDVVLPPNIAYGNLGSSDWLVPPNAIMTFNIELHELREETYGRILSYLVVLAVIYAVYLKIDAAFAGKPKKKVA